MKLAFIAPHSPYQLRFWWHQFSLYWIPIVLCLSVLICAYIVTHPASITTSKNGLANQRRIQLVNR